MPTYLFQNKKTGEIKEVIQKMTDEHVYSDADGEYERVFVNPKIAFDTKTQAFSEKDFVKSTANKNYTVGDLWDKSAELSEKRREKEGKDPVKEKAVKAYEKKTKGKPHPLAKQGRVETKDYIIE